MRVIIFGSNGMLGTYLCKFLKKKYTIIPFTRKDIDISRASKKEIFNFFESNIFEGDIIINASVITNRSEYEISDMITVNSLFPNYLSKLKQKIKCNVIHITTDSVFNGLKGGYNENAPHDCLDEYGKSKSLGENNLITVIRTSIIGEEIRNKKSLLEWVKSQYGKEIFGYENHLWNGLTCLELSKYIDTIISTNDFWLGVKHIFSPDIVSKFELISMINEIYELNISIIKKETNQICFRNLSTIYELPIKKSIHSQITELKKFSLI
jgi:dTDP-4-dehydrorhamnose reductase